MPSPVTTERYMTSTTHARCFNCDWGSIYGLKALSTVDGRLLRSRARAHAESRGHEVGVDVERISHSRFHPAVPHG